MNQTDEQVVRRLKRLASNEFYQVQWILYRLGVSQKPEQKIKPTFWVGLPIKRPGSY